jgi:hypothetical protein
MSVKPHKNRRVVWLRSAVNAVAMVLLSGCTSAGLSTAKILQDAIVGSSVQIPANLSVSPYRYLWAKSNDSKALLVLGAVEPSDSGSIEVWFSANQEILRIQTGALGRIVSTRGLQTDWVRSSLRVNPNVSGSLKVLLRERDVMPGWRYGLTETLRQTSFRKPPRLARQKFRPELLNSKKVTSWLMENSPQAPELGESVYARDAAGQVIAGYQCLAADLCIAWERLN